MIRALGLAGLIAASLPVCAADASRVVTLGGSLTEIVYALGKGDHLAGVDATSTFPAETAKLPQVGYVRTLSAEGILALRPTLILATSEAGPPEALAHLRSAGIAVEVIEEKRTFENVREKISRIGTLLGADEQAVALVAEMDRDLKKLGERKDGSGAAPKAVFLMSRGQGALIAAGRDTAADVMISAAGGVNAITDYAGYKPVTAEAMVAASPEWIITSTRSLEAAGGAEVLFQSPGLALTPAGKERRLIAMDDLYLLGFGPRSVKAALELAEKLAAQ
jgi:iron complex transport system substrate-binding protein